MARARVVLGALVAVLAVILVGTAAAEETRSVGGYQVTVGFAHTPVYPQEANPVIIRIATTSGEPVTGVEKSLRLRVGVPNQVTETWNLDPVPGQPGAYRVILALPRAGTFFLDLFGDIQGQPVQEHFVTGQNGLEKVIAHGRSYPRGAWLVVLVTFGGYLVFLAGYYGRLLLRLRRARHPASLG
jgi:hypothetical protein